MGLFELFVDHLCQSEPIWGLFEPIDSCCEPILGLFGHILGLLVFDVYFSAFGAYLDPFLAWTLNLCLARRIAQSLPKRVLGYPIGPIQWALRPI